MRQITRVSNEQRKLDSYIQISPLKVSSELFLAVLSITGSDNDASIIPFLFFLTRAEQVIHQLQNRRQIMMIQVLRWDEGVLRFLLWTQLMKK